MIRYFTSVSVLVLMLAVAASANFAFAATVSISPAAGPPTTNVTVSGSGFTAGEKVSLAFDASTAASATADAAGNFSHSVLIPKSAHPGAHNLQATGQRSGITKSATFSVQTNWPAFKNQPTRVGVNPSENTINKSNAKFLVQAWIGIMGDLVDFSSPAVVNGVVYIGSFDGRLYAFNADGCAPSTTCQPLWSGATGNDITSSPAVANGVVYIGSADRKEYTVIGDVVNVAFRIEALNKEFGSKLLISERVRQQAGLNGAGERLPPVAIRGRSEVVELFRLA